MSDAKLRIGLLGRGDISARYAGTLSRAEAVSLVARASRTSPNEASACDWEEVSVEGLFDRDDIGLIVNLTPPLSHAETTERALRAGKHVYSEKPLAAGLAQADSLIALARDRGLTLACAPATFLGPAQQTARRMIDAGELGRVLGASVNLIYPGPDLWHHRPQALFGPAAGPIFDMGVYDVTALVHLLGPVARVVAAGSRARDERTVQAGPDAGSRFPVTVLDACRGPPRVRVPVPAPR